MEQETKTPNTKNILNLIVQVFYFLEEEYLYTHTYNFKKDSLFIDNLNVEYFNESKRRSIRISYTKAKVFNEIRYTFSFSITRIPYVGVEDFFSLSNYLQSIGKDFSTCLINDFNYIEAEGILKKIANSLKEYALKIIDGTEWLATYYPRKD